MSGEVNNVNVEEKIAINENVAELPSIELDQVPEYHEYIESFLKEFNT